VTAADNLKPFGSQQRGQQIDEQQQRYEASQREHAILDFASEIALNPFTPGSEGEHHPQCRKSQEQQCWQPNFQVHLERLRDGYRISLQATRRLNSKRNDHAGELKSLNC
jgi:hypothetical protein